VSVATEELIVGVPRWLAPSIDVKEGRDPLGLQTTTQDRLTPRLLPGILELSRRGRYVSFHAYMLDQYRQLGGKATNADLSIFIKRREWDYGLAVFKCPHECGSIPVGANAIRAAMGTTPGPYPRGESVESSLGGYGLFYRSPMAALGIVARAGTPLGGTPLPIDVLYTHDRARRLADTFAVAVAHTEYVSSWMLTSDPIPAEVLVEYAHVACLCQLSAHPDERSAVQDALFGDDPFDDHATIRTVDVHEVGADGLLAGTLDDRLEMSRTAAVYQRRRSVAHFLTLIEYDPTVVEDESAYREAMWSGPTRNDDHRDIAGQWAGLVAKDIWQDALCSVWAEFCHAGLVAAAEGDGLSWAETRALAEGLTNGPPSVAGNTPTSKLIDGIAIGTTTLPGITGPLAVASLEELRRATVRASTAMSGVVVVLELHRRAIGRTDSGWLATAGVRSVWQPSLLAVLDGLSSHLSAEPTVSDTLWWLVDRFVIAVHERIAYSKLQQREHTFRFRWEDGNVRFYANGVGRFPLAAIRNEPLASLTRDLGFWAADSDGRAQLTDRGRAFVDEVLT
jgi:hypothetical protein